MTECSRSSQKPCNQILRDYDILCRHGGEEFLLVLPFTSLPKAVEIAERIQKKITEIAVRSEKGEVITMTISAGVAQLKEKENIDDLIMKHNTFGGDKKAGKSLLTAAENKLKY